MTVALSIVDRTLTHKAPLRDQPLLAFTQNGTPLVGQSGSMYEITFDDATRNVVVFGGTGRGKTESIMLPAAARLIGTGCTGLILDAKGDFTVLAQQFPQSTMIIGPASGTSINLLGGIETGTFRAIMENLQSKYHKSEKYWGALGVEDAVLIFLFVRETGREPTLKDIHDGLTRPKDFCLKVERFLLMQAMVSRELLDQIGSRSSDEFGLLRLGEFQGEESDSSRAKEQYSWQTNAIVKSLGVIVSNPQLAKAFCSVDSKSISELAHDQRKTLVLNMNADQYPDASFTIARMLRLQYMRSITTTHFRRRELGLGETTYTFMLVDEYQQFVNASVREQSDVLRDDNTWFDRSRGYGHINIVATQSVSSLYAQVEASAAETIIQNCQNTIILPTTDIPTLQRAEILSGQTGSFKVLTGALINPGGQGEGFVHIANAHARKGASIGGLMRAGIITQTDYSYMNAYIGVSHKRVHELLFSDSHLITRNPYVRSRPNQCNGRLHVIVNKLYALTGEWLAALTDHRRIEFVGIVDYPAQSDLPWEGRRDFGDYADYIQADDIVVIPNFKDPKQESILCSRQLLQLVQEVNESSVGVVFGKGTHKTIELERKADHVVDSPYELITFVHELLGNG